MRHYQIRQEASKQNAMYVENWLHETGLGKLCKMLGVRNMLTERMECLNVKFEFLVAVTTATALFREVDAVALLVKALCYRQEGHWISQFT
jgi:hypothetical protein